MINEPFSENEEWNWRWDEDAQAIINKFGWKGLAMASAYYDPDGAEKKDEDGYPMSKDCYYLPHHKLINGELTLVKGGVFAAMKRLLQTYSRVKKGEIDSKINFKEAYKHLVGHYKFFKQEPPELNKSDASLINFPIWTKDYNIVSDLTTNDISIAVEYLFRAWLDEIEYLIVCLLPLNDEELTDERLLQLFKALEVFEAIKEKMKKVIEFYSSIKQVQGGTKMDIKELLQKIEAGELDKETIKEALGFVGIEEVENLKKEIEELRQAKEVIEKEYAEFRQVVEAEKEARRKAELAENRFKELVENGIEFSSERVEKIKSKLANMSDEEYEDYKFELLDVLATKKKKVEDEEKEEEAEKKKSKATKDIFKDEINNEFYNPELAFNLRQRRAALNIELNPAETDLELVKKFQKILFEEVK